MGTADRTSDDPRRVLRRQLFLTRVGLIAERIVRAFWPLWVVVLFGVAVFRLGLPGLLPLEALWAGGVGLLAATLWALVRGVRRFRWPTANAAASRLDDTLAGHPLSALADRQAIGAGDTASEAVWRVHAARMRARLAEARAVPPDVNLARLDPYGLRYVALTLFVVALLFGTTLRLGAPGQPVLPGGAGGQLAAGPSWEGWIEPPAYTGRPGLYLNDLPPGRVEVPADSRVELRLYGDVGALSVAETVSARTGEIGAASAVAQAFDIVQPGRIEIMGPGGASWDIVLMPDAAPEIAASGPLRSEASGEMTQPFSARDDFGVIAGTAEIVLDLDEVARIHGLTAPPDPRDPIIVPLPLPLTGQRTDFEGALVEDFSKHPWANLPVILVMQAEDAAGATGLSEPLAYDALPGRRFFDPLAKALIEQRRDLLWSRDNAPRVARLLRAVSHLPDGVFRTETDYLRTRFIARELESGAASGLSAVQQDEIAEALWQLALRIEEGDLSDAAERLRRAQERLSEAMRNGATNEEIADLMQELREAMQDYMRQLAEQMDPDQAPQDLSDAQELTGQDLQDLLDRLQQLMEEGRMAEAQALLDQLNQMMQNLQMAQNQGQGQQSPGQQAMQGLQETLRDQQNLSDEAFQGMQGQQGQGQQSEGQQGEGQQQGQMGQGQPGGQQGQGQSQGQGEAQGQGQAPGEGQDLGQQLAERQEQLRSELQRQREGLPGAGQGAADARRSLDEAGEAMERAEDALRGEDLAGAMDNQAEAMDRLRDGIQSLGEELAQQQQQQQGGGGQGQALGDPGANAQRDPLGRSSGGSGELGTRDNLLQDEDVYRRARDLLDEIRRRSSDQTRPDVELDYLRRLLDRF